MSDLEKLLKKVQAFNKNKEWQKTLDTLPDAVLEQWRSADLYAENAEACWRLKQREASKEAAEKTLAIEPEHAKGNHYLGVWYYHKKDYSNAEEYFNKARTVNPDFAPPYNGLGLIHSQRKEYDKAIENYQKAIGFDTEYALAYNNLSNVYSQRKEYDKAIENYQKAIELDPEYARPYNGLGLIHSRHKEYDKAIENYQKAIGLDPEYARSYNNLGNVYFQRKEYDKAIENYQKAIELDPEYARPYYDLGLVYKDLEKFKESKQLFEKYLELTPHTDKTDFRALKAREYIAELIKLIGNSDSYGNINKLVVKIKNLLHFREGYIAHYTSFSVAHKLILEGSKFRLSEGAFLNDTSEGRELYNFLPDFQGKPNNNQETVTVAFSRKPFIGSFVNEKKHNDLTLWRMYGKEAKEEAKGCAITLDMQKLVEQLKADMESKRDKDNTTTLDMEFNFYQVAYWQEDKEAFLLHDIDIEGNGKQEKLNQYMKDLAEAVKSFDEHKKKNPKEETRDVMILLNTIAYLFKSAEYQYEHEIRLVIDSPIGFDLVIEESGDPSRVYIELGDIRKSIKQLTLGPKIDRADEWAATFYYSLQKDGLTPDIFISHLPFK